MIKVNKRFSQPLLDDIRINILDKAVLQRARNFISKLDEDCEYKNSLSKILSYKSLQSFIMSSADKHVRITNHVENELPIVIERYNQTLFFSSLNVDINIKKQKDFNSRVEYYSYLKNLSKQYLIEFTIFSNNKKSIILKYLINKLQIIIGTQNNTAATYKSIFNEIKTMVNGTASCDVLNSLFPGWMIDFAKIFEYKQLAKGQAYSLIRELNMSACPYCNQEDIIIREPHQIDKSGRSHRPALDHFLPKSLYPFLALNVYNLLPSGDRCNRSFKADFDMVDHVNPHFGGVIDEPLFGIFLNNSLPRRDLPRDEIEITLHENTKLNNNLKTFQIRSIYNDHDIKDEAIDLINKFEVSKELGLLKHQTPENVKTLKIITGVNLELSPHHGRIQKFKIDIYKNLLALNSM